MKKEDITAWRRKAAYIMDLLTYRSFFLSSYIGLERSTYLGFRIPFLEKFSCSFLHRTQRTMSSLLRYLAHKLLTSKLPNSKKYFHDAVLILLIIFEHFFNLKKLQHAIFFY